MNGISKIIPGPIHAKHASDKCYGNKILMFDTKHIIKHPKDLRRMPFCTYKMIIMHTTHAQKYKRSIVNIEFTIESFLLLMTRCNGNECNASILMRISLAS